MGLAFWQNIPTGTARAVLFNNFESSLVTQMSDEQHRLVLVPLKQIPRIENLISTVMGCLAEAALALWPCWYGVENIAEQPPSSLMLDSKKGSVQRHWFEAAKHYSALGKIPLIKSIPNTVQVEQLALAIALKELVVVISTSSENSPDERLLGIAQTANWLAREAQVRVAVLLPESAQQRAALDSILFNALHLDVVLPDNYAVANKSKDGIDVPIGGGKTPQEHRSKKHPIPDEEHYRILPIIGHPHPFSPGEQALATAIRADSELAPLFGFNLYVDSTKGSHFLVDLLWRDGRMVIEVDGYRFHSNRASFASDRQRDFELLISHYRVVRITHDEAVTGTATAIAKIREVVHFIQLSTPSKIQ